MTVGGGGVLDFMWTVLNVAERVTYYFTCCTLLCCWQEPVFNCTQLVLEEYNSDHMWQAMHIKLGFSVVRITIYIFIFLN